MEKAWALSGSAVLRKDMVEVGGAVLRKALTGLVGQWSCVKAAASFRISISGGRRGTQSRQYEYLP